MVIYIFTLSELGGPFFCIPKKKISLKRHSAKLDDWKQVELSLIPPPFESETCNGLHSLRKAGEEPITHGNIHRQLFASFYVYIYRQVIRDSDLWMLTLTDLKSKHPPPSSYWCSFEPSSYGSVDPAAVRVSVAHHAWLIYIAHWHLVKFGKKP